jgi:hypothetical protein
MQNSYSVNTINAFAGQLADIAGSNIRSYAAMQPIPFGVALAQGKAKASQCRLPQINSTVLTESVPMVAANSTVGTVNVTTYVAGVSTLVSTNIAPVVFVTSDPVTLTAIAAAIALVPGVLSAVAGASNITVTANPDTQVTLSGFVTTLGAGQPLWTAVGTSNDLIIGVSVMEQTIENAMNQQVFYPLTDSTAQYPYAKAVNVLRRGLIFVACEQTVNPGDPVFTRFQVGAVGTVLGGFRKDADTGKALQLPRAAWVETIQAGAVGVLDISLP